jgi:hypothetical protein
VPSPQVARNYAQVQGLASGQSYAKAYCTLAFEDVLVLNGQVRGPPACLPCCGAAVPEVEGRVLRNRIVRRVHA